MRPLARLALVPLLALAGCGGGGLAPTLHLTTVLADGRSCRDAGVSMIELAFGASPPPRYTCLESALPLAVEAVGLPLADEVEVRGLSMQGALLYRGRLVATEVLSTSMAAVTVTLYPAAVR